MMGTMWESIMESGKAILRIIWPKGNGKLPPDKGTILTQVCFTTGEPIEGANIHQAPYYEDMYITDKYGRAYCPRAWLDQTVEIQLERPGQKPLIKSAGFRRVANKDHVLITIQAPWQTDSSRLAFPPPPQDQSDAIRIVTPVEDHPPLLPKPDCSKKKPAAKNGHPHKNGNGKKRKNSQARNQVQL